MLNRDDALNLVEIALRHAKADQTEVLFLSASSGLTRLANGSIHQHVSTDDTQVRVRAVKGKRIGVVSSNRIDVAHLRALVDRATEVARLAEPNPEFVSLPAPEDGGETPALTGPVPTLIPASDPEAVSPEGRAGRAAQLINTAVGNGVTVAGHVATTHTALAVGNSLGVRAFHTWPHAGVMAIMTKDGASGYADWAGTNLADAPVGEIAGRACSKCLAGTDPDTAPPGAYTVVLEPPAVAEMLAMLAFMGLGATAYQEGRSFLSGQLGKQLVGENITLHDDTYHPGMLTIPFDDEGVPRQAVTFFDGGVARGVVYDSATAHKEQRRSTGHALPAPNPYGPLPRHLVLHPGGVEREALIGGIAHGILVTRFHYVNSVHPKETILTGMTRDGTFLIEQGSVTRPVKNLRFTQSVLEALRRVTGIERTLTLVNQEGIFCQAPALRIDGFTFTS